MRNGEVEGEGWRGERRRQRKDQRINLNKGKRYKVQKKIKKDIYKEKRAILEIVAETFVGASAVVVKVIIVIRF